MKIFFDVTVILDFFLERSPKQDIINLLFERLDEDEFTGFITLSIIQTCAYYLQLAKGTVVTKEIIGVICKKFQFIEGTKFEIMSAIESDHKDVEDSIYYFTCIRNNMDLLLTNDRDFLRLSQPHFPVITPEILVEKYLQN